ncbi:hypothetical protein TcasGA2_TC032698 [Tribolium castaneum]|uniref:Uncharacterized protein n=1 Tax=Tribolium castaneum TaxID=7070 RepID=A0A139WK78_TRICA|nr:hypothetical protein TcasGA2_TC032698 [Tribolium castaneum]
MCELLKNNWSNFNEIQLMKKFQQYGMSEDQIWNYIDNYMGCSKMNGALSF